MRKSYVIEVLDIVRKHNSYGFVKEADASKIEEIVEQYVNESVMVEKEIAYNNGFIDGVRSAQRGSVN